MKQNVPVSHHFLRKQVLSYTCSEQIMNSYIFSFLSISSYSNIHIWVFYTCLFTLSCVLGFNMLSQPMHKDCNYLFPLVQFSNTCIWHSWKLSPIHLSTSIIIHLSRKEKRQSKILLTSSVCFLATLITTKAYFKCSHSWPVSYLFCHGAAYQPFNCTDATVYGPTQ